MELDFKQDVKIDPDQLEIEWMRQGELNAEYGELYADAREVTRRAEQNIKLIRSRLILSAKRGQLKEEIGTASPSDNVCEAYYRTHPDYTEATEAWIQAQKEEDLLQQAVFSIKDRKDALEALVRLLGMDYFGGPLEPHDLTSDSEFMKEVEIQKQERQAAITMRMAEKAIPACRSRRRNRQEE